MFFVRMYVHMYVCVCVCARMYISKREEEEQERKCGERERGVYIFSRYKNLYHLVNHCPDIFRFAAFLCHPSSTRETQMHYFVQFDVCDVFR